MIASRIGALVVSIAVGFVVASAACGGATEREHTSTVVRGTYGDPNPIVACGDARDASADTGDAQPDGC